MHVIQTQAPPAVVGPWSKATACIFEVYQESRRGERGAFIGYLRVAAGVGRVDLGLGTAGAVRFSHAPGRVDQQQQVTDYVLSEQGAEGELHCTGANGMAKPCENPPTAANPRWTLQGEARP